MESMNGDLLWAVKTPVKMHWLSCRDSFNAQCVNWEDSYKRQSMVALDTWSHCRCLDPCLPLSTWYFIKMHNINPCRKARIRNRCLFCKKTPNKHKTRCQCNPETEPTMAAEVKALRLYFLLHSSAGPLLTLFQHIKGKRLDQEMSEFNLL